MRSFFTKSGSPNSSIPLMTETENDEVHRLAFTAAEEGEKPGMHRTFILKRSLLNQDRCGLPSLAVRAMARKALTPLAKASINIAK